MLPDDAWLLWLARSRNVWMGVKEGQIMHGWSGLPGVASHYHTGILYVHEMYESHLGVPNRRQWCGVCCLGIFASTSRPSTPAVQPLRASRSTREVTPAGRWGLARPSLRLCTIVNPFRSYSCINWHRYSCLPAASMLSLDQSAAAAPGQPQSAVGCQLPAASSLPICLDPAILS